MYYAYICTVRSILLSVRARSWAHRGLNNKTRIHTGNDRRRRGRGRPCGAHKASPRLIPLPPPSSSSCPFSSPRRAAAFPRAENARPVPGIQSERQHRPSLPRPPSPCPPSFPLHPAVISSTRSPGLCQARRSLWPCTTARSSVRPGALHHGGVGAPW